MGSGYEMADERAFKRLGLACSEEVGSGNVRRKAAANFEFVWPMSHMIAEKPITNPNCHVRFDLTVEALPVHSLQRFRLSAG
jgi:hypothetical protein